MTDEIVRFETAKILKEKKFKEYCDFLFNEKGEIEKVGNYNYVDDDKYISYSTLTQSLVQKWLREVHGIYVMITQEFYKDGICHLFQVCKYKEGNYTCSGLYGDNGEFSSYEDCLEEGILYALNLI